MEYCDCIYSNNDILIVGRGGGSIEDLWAFNEECVADEIFNSTIPIISAVGHENDFVISDFVADVRASTPSNAIEIATPNINDLRQFTDTINDDFNHKFKTILFNKEQELKHLKSLYTYQSFGKRFEVVQSSINTIKEQYKYSFLQVIKDNQSKVNILKNSYELNIPSKKDKKGFVQLTKNNKITNLSNLNKKDKIILQDSNFVVDCEVISKTII